MSIRIIEKLKNQQGSSLAFVLIIGMIIMIMVASLLAVANSDFTFTQETVESRQAYIDAKSVIEYGKIEINSREKELSAAYQALVAERNNKEPSETTIQRLLADIAALERKVTTIYGNETNPSGSLSFSNDGTMTEFGKVSVQKNETVVNTTDTSQYIFKVETENLRRKLDYQTDFKYEVKTIPGSSGTLVPPNRPDLVTLFPCPDTNVNSWVKTQLTGSADGLSTQCKITDTAEPYRSDYDSGSKLNILNVNAGSKDLDVNAFSWANNSVLNLTAKNIYFTALIPTASVNNISYNITADQTSGEIRFQKDYIQKNKGKNTLKAKNIVFEGNLEIYDSNELVINCDTLWVKGNIMINTSTGSNSKLIIHAKNVIIDNPKKNQASNVLIGSTSSLDLNCSESLLITGDIRVCYPEKNAAEYGSGSSININAINACILNTHNKHNGKVYIGSYSTAKWECDNIWIDGDIETTKTGSKLIYNNLNYLKAGNIELDHDGQLIVEGESGQKNLIEIGLITKLEGNSAKVSISKFCLMTCQGIYLEDNSTLNLDVGAIKIDGNFTLLRSGVNDKGETLDIDCEYFDCTGMTTISSLKDKLNFNPKNDILNLRFYGGYNQLNSKVNINGADKVIFGNPGIGQGNSFGNAGPIKLSEWNSGDFKLDIKSDAIYLDAKSIEFQKMNLNFNYSGKNTASVSLFNIRTGISGRLGNYENVNGASISALPVQNKDYTPPDWPPTVSPSCLGSSGGSTIIISPGTEKYY
ncbi:hypothetical protein [Acetobacterium wieringae]|uniref:hypothetical protein n=1 Tax=Acetobacterium wieringae TaxID=52694 RepID=UPI002B2135EB|nr:hypothetical protein [Acetobacterium wieringae]MEA4805999.1 hypothetical protein [Acetobacterium wieringae]